MISRLTGSCTYKDRHAVVVDVGGVGYRVVLMPSALAEINIGDDTALWTHLASREDGLDLYGFLEKEGLDFFELLIGISGIGPKTALGILSIAPPKILERAIATGNTTYLTKVSGIGRKNAEKIVLELKDKMKALAKEEGMVMGEDADVLLALESLGYGKKEAREAVQEVPESVTSVNGRIKEALKYLSK